MSRNRIIESTEYLVEDLDYHKWPTVHCDNRNEKFNNRKKAVELYLECKKSMTEITILTGIGRKELNVFVKKCLSRHEDGKVWGFRALLPYRRIGKSYLRLADTEGFNKPKLTGAFQRLLEQYPNLDILIQDYIFNRRKRSIADRIIRIKDLREKFLKLCKAEGISLNQYPFNTKDMCLRTLARYVDFLTSEHPEMSGNRFGEETKRKLKRFDGNESSKDRVVVPFQVVHLDGHKLDALFTITFTNAFGDEVTEIMSRIWLILIMDEGTRAVLGHHICLNVEYSSIDVLHCIKNAIVPWKRKELTIPGLNYPDTPGYHSDAIPETAWAVWAEMKYDNAFANLANVVKDRLTKVVNCSVNPGAVQFPEARNIVERFFGLLEKNYIHRLSNTTGSNPKDHKRFKPEKVAKKYKIHADEIEQLIEIIIANYNNTIHSSSGLSPLQAMEQRIRHRDMLPRVLDIEKREDVNFFSMNITRTIRGSKKTGKRPHINFEGAEYSSELLAKNFSLVGTELNVQVNIDDISILKVYLPDGQELDFLKVKGNWSMRQHSLRTRKIINKLVRDGKLQLDDRESPVETLEKYYVQQAPKEKAVRNSLASLQRYNQEAIKKDGMEIIDNSEVEIHTLQSLEEIENIIPSHNDDLEHLRKILRTNC